MQELDPLVDYLVAMGFYWFNQLFPFFQKLERTNIIATKTISEKVIALLVLVVNLTSTKYIILSDSQIVQTP